MAQIECKDVSVKYESQEVLKDISFSIEAGDYLCIVGENGSGKSTLVKTILGLENAKTGEVIFGDNLNKNEIGYLPQQTQAQMLSASPNYRGSHRKGGDGHLHIPEQVLACQELQIGRASCRERV